MKMKLKKNQAFLAGLCAVLSSSLATQAAVVFPIADSPDVVQVCDGLAFDGTNYLAALEVGSEIGAQLISPAGTLIGSRLNVGSSSIFPPALTAAFGGGEFLEVWSDNTVNSGVDMFGQRISTAGAKLGLRFPLLSSVGSHGFQTVCALGFGGGNFLVVWRDGTSGDFYGQIVTAAGGLSGSEFLISDQQQNGKSASVAFDGTNFLVVWQSNNTGQGGDTNNTFGAFVSPSGLAQSPFQISQTTSLDQDPSAVAFDGTNYLVVWSKDTQVNAKDVVLDWTLYGRFVSPGGALSASEVVLAGYPGNQAFPNLAFDGQSYLLVWSAYTNTSSATSLRGQFFDRSANAVSQAFAALPPMGMNDPLPAFNGLVYDGTRFVLAGGYGSFIRNSNGDDTGFAHAQAWGVFIPPTLTPPKIYTEPSSMTNLAGTTATWQVPVEGSALDYQWFKNRVKLASSTRISGVNSASLTISNLALADAGTYFLLASNLFGAAISSNATLTVVTPVTITTKSSPLKVATLAGGGSYTGDSTVTVTAIVTNDCYYFTNWTASGKVVSTDSTYMFTAGKSETLTANFLPFLYEVQTASAPANGGTTKGGGAKECGSSVTVTASAKTGFKFENWTQGATVISSDASYKLFPVSEDVQLTANFIDIAPPSLTVTTPTGTAKTTNAELTIAGRASDNVAVANVFYSINNGAYIAAQTSNNGSNWSATVNLAPGTNSIEVYAVDTSGLKSAVKTLVVVYQGEVSSEVSMFPVSTGYLVKHPQAQVAFDGTNYMVAYQIYTPAGATTNSSKPVGQLVSSSGDLIGALFQGANTTDPPYVAFDGTNYLLASADHSHQTGVPITGQLISTAGVGVGGLFQISQSETVDGMQSLVFGGGNYLVTWEDSRDVANQSGYDDIYGALLNPDGNLIANEFEIGAEGVRSAAAFDGTNFLVIWSDAVTGTGVSGRLISPSGTLVTEPFVIYTNSTPNDFENTVAFGGTRFLVAIADQTSAQNVSVYGRFVTPDGEVLTNQITIADNPGGKGLLSGAFDGTNYLVTWDQGLNLMGPTVPPSSVNAKFLDTEGNPASSEFAIFASQGDKSAVEAAVLFDGTRFFAAGGLGIPPNSGLVFNTFFTNAVIYGEFIVP